MLHYAVSILNFNLSNLYPVSDEGKVLTNPIIGLRVEGIFEGVSLA